MNRVHSLASAALVLCLASFAGAQEPSQPKLVVPPPRSADGSDRLKQFQAELEALRKARADAAGSAATGADMSQDERAKLKTRMNELVERIKARDASPPPRPVAPVEPVKNDPASESGRTVDRLRLVHNLLRTGESQAALRAIQLIEPASLNSKESALVRYMTAACYRRMGNLDKAKEIYREVAASKDDAFLAECALWQSRSIEIRASPPAPADTTPAKSSPK